MGNQMRCRGFTLIEAIVATAIFAIVTTLIVSFFTLSQTYYAAGSSQADVQMGTQYALAEVAKDIQESDPAGISPAAPNSSTALVLISSRNSSGQFVIYNGEPSGSGSNCGSSPTSDAGKPCWQKWICYYLTPRTGTSYYELIRKEEALTTINTELSSIVPAPTPSAASIESASVPQTVLSQYIETFNIQTSCGISGMYYLQLNAAKTYGGQLTTYNPGIPVNSGNCASGNWILSLPNN